MRRYSLFLVLLLAFFTLWMSIPQPASAQDAIATPEPTITASVGTELPSLVTPASVGISAPGNGANLSGVVVVSGTTLSAWDLSFSYADDPTGTWFPLAQSSDPVSAGTLTSWDTTTITDGFYVLRLHVSAVDGSQYFKVNVRVRNYSPVETATLTLTPTAAPTFTLVPVIATATATFTPAPTPTIPAPLPPNPATLSTQEIVVNFGKGAFGVIALFAFFGVLLSLSRKLRS